MGSSCLGWTVGDGNQGRWDSRTMERGSGRRGRRNAVLRCWLSSVRSSRVGASGRLGKGLHEEDAGGQENGNLGGLAAPKDARSVTIMEG